MDRFEQFGEAMVVLDTLLPPGVTFRKNCMGLNKALMGMEMQKNDDDDGSDGPDWEEVADLQHEQAMNSYNYDWENTQRQYNHMLLQNVVQEYDQTVQHGYQTAQQEQQWMYATAQQEQKYNAEVAAFNKSEKMFGWQVDMNQISAQMALDDQRAQTNERYQALAFEAQIADLQQATKKTDLSMQGMGVDLDIYSKRTAGQRKKQGLTIEQQTKRGQAAAVGVEDAVKGMQAAGQVEARGQAGGSTNKQYQSMVAQFSRLQAAKAYELNRSDFATRLALNGVDQTLAEQEAASNLSNAKIGAGVKTADLEYALGIKQRDATKLSIGGAHDRAAKKIELDQYKANVQADLNRMSQPTMGIPIPKPLEIPMATIMDPIVPVRGEPPVWGTGGGMGASSAGSTGGGGAVSGAMMAGGMAAASLPTLSGTTGAVSASIAAGGSAWGVGAMVPGIGIGIAAIGLIGMAAGWF
ncbi:MAG TPA: hypothetical protein QGH16_11050 [Verrucomicrobiota bacterium]|nr:hypothetical protein [Verrucomicrobiota bacterium]